VGIIEAPPSGAPSSTTASGPDGGPYRILGDPGLGSLPSGTAQPQVLCSRHNGDYVAKAFCAQPAPTITSLRDLEGLVGLALQPGNTYNGSKGGAMKPPNYGGNPTFALAGHSTSLVKRITSAINPRVILITPNGEGGPPPGQPTTPSLYAPNPSFVSLGFVRGEEFVELVANDPTADGGGFAGLDGGWVNPGELRFYLFQFEHTCTHTEGLRPRGLADAGRGNGLHRMDPVRGRGSQGHDHRLQVMPPTWRARYRQGPSHGRVARALDALVHPHRRRRHALQSTQQR
jgi:hypothetical protein